MTTFFPRTRVKTHVLLKYLRITALLECVIGIYKHDFTNKEQEILHCTRLPPRAVLNFEFLVCKRVLVNPITHEQRVLQTFQYSV